MLSTSAPTGLYRPLSDAGLHTGILVYLQNQQIKPTKTPLGRHCRLSCDSQDQFCHCSSFSFLFSFWCFLPPKMHTSMILSHTNRDEPDWAFYRNKNPLSSTPLLIVLFRSIVCFDAGCLPKLECGTHHLLLVRCLSQR